ncbi:amylase-binding protein [Streptococcus sp. HMSC34B10]|uniref:amylase-binding adhesin AbpA n=1 Tax=Streptococcus sp. HMSC34B10 TaxID=1608856 RepID=UPI0008A8C78D|nr:amylase-binding adhesin AbpA [Streptococcus sp. HMSC34B10]OHS86561.1 amylase-binding protein [Streptococcus sp. HMSC34B10]
MKKVLLSSVVALAVFSAAAPAFADINGGANTPGAYDSREAYENQSEFVSARTVEEYLAGHQEDIAAEAAADPAVVAAKAALDAVEGGSHKYGEIKAAYDEAYNEAFLKVRNVYVEKFQNVQNSAKKAEGNYYILNETPEQKNARYLKEHGLSDQAAADQVSADQAAADQAATEPESGTAVDQAKKADEAAKKAGASAKAGQKALPKTHAVK